ncbi:MAG TPA: hypothetical protein VND95_07530 [Stellaceae bacterium]|nr:hypothetical protein [Stellaceae bacterium]
MRSFAQRRYSNALIATVAAGAVIAIEMSRPPLVRQHSFTGWVLMASLVFLVVYNARKKIAVLPLLSAATWLQMHLYVGLFAVAVFVLHTGWQYPDGVFNQVLWWTFVALAVSGIFGIWAQRLIAPQVRNRGEAILYNRISALRMKLAAEAEQLAGHSVAELGSPLLVDFYCDRIVPFMAGARNFWSHLLGARDPIDRLLRDLRALERYLNPRGRDALRELEERVVAKDNLDHQYALVSVMRGWLFIHIPLAYGIFVLIALHVVLVYAFGGF